MKEIYFSEDQLNNLNKIGQNLFCAENDPTSPTYKRVLIRPKLNYMRMILNVGLPVVTFFTYIFILHMLELLSWTYILVALLLIMIYIIVFLKKAVICSIKIYQHFASDKIRRKCRFEPSCSQYMVLAIEKYGLIKGVSMGVKRLKRCNIKHGGYDFP